MDYKKIKLVKNDIDYIDESLLNEASRRELIDRSKNVDKTKTYGTTRYERRRKQHINGSLKTFNRIDMNALFKGDMLSIIIPVSGETDDYDVEILFEGVCSDIKDEIKRNKNKLEYKCVYRAIMSDIDKQDIYISCTCSDFKYRFSYWATKGKYNGGKPELRPANKTNPNNSKGIGCKHILKVLSELDWALKLATTIYNYIIYMKDNYNRKFVDIIYPALYDIPWDKAVQMNLFDTDDELANTIDNKGGQEDIDKAIDKSIYKGNNTSNNNNTSGEEDN